MSGEPFLSFDMMNTVHGLTQAVWDIRRLVSWIRAQGATSIGLYGVSLGAYVVSLLAGIEDGFDAVVAGVPVVDFPSLFHDHSPVHIRARSIEHRILGGVAEDVYRVVSPMSFEPKVIPDGRRFVFAGYGDRLAFPDQARRLWEHWDEAAYQLVLGKPRGISLVTPGRSVPRGVAGGVRTQLHSARPARAERWSRWSGSTPSSSIRRQRTTHMHTLKVAVFDMSGSPGGYSYDEIVELLGHRLDRFPPFRRRAVPVPLGLGHPVWVEDPDFDLRRHVTRRRVAEPGGDRELAAVVADVAGRPLPRDRPLWEIVVVDGLADDRLAVVAKVHHAVADGAATVALLQSALDSRAHGSTSGVPRCSPRGPQLLRLAGTWHMHAASAVAPIGIALGPGTARLGGPEARVTGQATAAVRHAEDDRSTSR